jgi:hypothetical protein
MKGVKTMLEVALDCLIGLRFVLGLGFLAFLYLPSKFTDDKFFRICLIYNGICCILFLPLFLRRMDALELASRIMWPYALFIAYVILVLVKTKLTTSKEA